MICWIIEKAREFQKNICFCFVDYAKAFYCVDHNKLWKILKKNGNTRPPELPPEICMQVKKQQLELDMEKQISLNFERIKWWLYIVTLLI